MDWKFYPKSKTVEKHRPSFAHDPPQIIVIKQKTMPKVMNVTDQTLITCENDNMHVKSILKKENNSLRMKKASRISFADKEGPKKEIANVVSVKSFRYLNKLNTFQLDEISSVKKKKCKWLCNFCFVQ